MQTPGSVTAALEDPAIGLMAIGPDQAEPITVDFDHFRAVPDEVDPTAPIVEAFADPATGEAPLLVSYTAERLDPDGGRAHYEWEFEDGNGASAERRRGPSPARARTRRRSR